MLKEFIGKGMVLESGWWAFQYLAVPADAGAEQLSATREAFLAGAAFLRDVYQAELGSSLDERKNEIIEKEVMAFRQQLIMRLCITGGQK